MQGISERDDSNKGQEHKEYIENASDNFLREQNITVNRTLSRIDDETLLTMLDQIISDPYNIELGERLSVVFARSEEYRKALLPLELLIQKYPRDTSNLYNMALFHIYLGEPEKAIKKLKTAINIEPKNPEIHKSLGISYLLSQDYFNALKHLTKAESLGIRDEHLMLNKGVCLFNVAEYKKASKEFSKSMTLGYTPGAEYLFGVSLAMVNKYAKAGMHMSNATRHEKEVRQITRYLRGVDQGRLQTANVIAAMNLLAYPDETEFLKSYRPKGYIRAEQITVKTMLN